MNLSSNREGWQKICSIFPTIHIYLHDGTEILSLICATRALNMLLNGEIIIFVEAIYACTNVKGTFEVIKKHHISVWLLMVLLLLLMIKLHSVNNFCLASADTPGKRTKVELKYLITQASKCIVLILHELIIYETA